MQARDLGPGKTGITNIEITPHSGGLKLERGKDGESCLVKSLPKNAFTGAAAYPVIQISPQGDTIFVSVKKWLAELLNALSATRRRSL